MANGVGGPYPPTFDCPMRQLALEFAQDIQPWLTTTSLQEIADALNGYDINIHNLCHLTNPKYNTTQMSRINK